MQESIIHILHEDYISFNGKLNVLQGDIRVTRMVEIIHLEQD